PLAGRHPVLRDEARIRTLAARSDRGGEWSRRAIGAAAQRSRSCRGDFLCTQPQDHSSRSKTIERHGREVGETVVIDWGLAKDQSEDSNTPDLVDGPYRAAAGDQTALGTILGTPAYMPPEQARGELVDERADVYALGAMLYHLLSGSPPYEGSNATEVLDRVLHQAVLPLEERASGAPRDLIAIARKAMSRDASSRYPTAREVAEDLRRFQTGQLVGAHESSPYMLLRRWLQRYRLPVAIAASMLALLATTLVVSARRILRERSAAIARANELILLQAHSAL